MKIIRLIDYSEKTKVYAIRCLHLTRAKEWVGYALNKKRDSNAFIYIHSGGVEFKNKAGERTVCGTNEMIFVPKGTEYASIYTAELTEITVINFSMEDEGEEATFGDCMEIMPPEYAVRYKRAFLAFDERGKNVNVNLHNTICFCRLLADMNVENYAAENENLYALIAVGAEVLKERFTENIPISDIARLSAVSESYFRRIFKSYYGKTPVEFRNELRIGYAHELYATGLYTKAEAARAAGIENPNYFSRLNTRYAKEEKKSKKK